MSERPAFWVHGKEDFDPKPVTFSYHTHGVAYNKPRQAGTVRVIILGEVQKPGLYYFNEGTTIEDAVGAAGLKTFTSSRATLLREDGENEVRTRPSIRRSNEDYGGDIMIQEGDIILFDYIMW